MLLLICEILKNQTHKNREWNSGYLPGANTRDPTHESHEGENLTGKADQVFRDFEKLPLALTLKMMSVFLMPASMDYSLISVTQAEGLPRSLPK